MLNLYCFHSCGELLEQFQEAQWTVQDDVCDDLEPEDARGEIQPVLQEDLCDALCFDTAADTRVFVLRNARVPYRAHAGRDHAGRTRAEWILNFALEADAESLPVWADMTAAFLTDYPDMISRFAALFRIRHNGGTHYEMDTAGFLELLRSAAGSAAMAQDLPMKSIRPFVRQLCRAPAMSPGRLWLLVPLTTKREFLEASVLADLSQPRLCLTRGQWQDLLLQKEVKSPYVSDGGDDGQEPEKAVSALPALPVVLAAVSAAAVIGGVCAGLWLSRQRRLERLEQERLELERLEQERMELERLEQENRRLRNRIRRLVNGGEKQRTTAGSGGADVAVFLRSGADRVRAFFQ